MAGVLITAIQLRDCFVQERINESTSRYRRCRTELAECQILTSDA